MVKTAVIIAGGLGLRLMPLTQDRPKTLVEISGKPILYWILNWLKPYGIEHVVLAVSHRKEQIADYLKQNNNFGFTIDFSEDSGKEGSGEAFRLAIERFVKDDVFLAMNADQLTNFDINEFVKKHEESGAIVTLSLNQLQSPYSIVNLDENGFVSSFSYKPMIPDKLVSNGFYVFSKEILQYIPEKGAIETTTFVELSKQKKVSSFLLKPSDFWIGVDSVKDVSKAEEILSKAGLKQVI